MKKQSRKKEEISTETVMHVARLARINITEKEAKKYQKDINEILSAFREIKRIKSKVQPSFQPVPVRDVYRKDEIEKSLTQEEALANTKHKENGFFKGPRAV